MHSVAPGSMHSSNGTPGSVSVSNSLSLSHKCGKSSSTFCSDDLGEGVALSTTTSSRTDAPTDGGCRDPREPKGSDREGTDSSPRSSTAGSSTRKTTRQLRIQREARRRRRKLATAQREKQRQDEYNRWYRGQNVNEVRHMPYFCVSWHKCQTVS